MDKHVKNKRTAFVLAQGSRIFISLSKGGGRPVEPLLHGMDMGLRGNENKFF
jgi:hypothetical protein